MTGARFDLGALVAELQQVPQTLDDLERWLDGYQDRDHQFEVCSSRGCVLHDYVVAALAPTFTEGLDMDVLIGIDHVAVRVLHGEKPLVSIPLSPEFVAVRALFDARYSGSQYRATPYDVAANVVSTARLVAVAYASAKPLVAKTIS